METIKRNEEVAVVASQFIKEKEYWLNKLSGESVKCVLPVDFKKSEGKGTKPVFDEVKFNLEDQYFTHLMKLSSNSDSRLHMILVTAVTVLMNKYTGNDDILMGIPVDMQEEEGEFINSALALRHQISEGGSFKELLLQVRKNIVEATDNQNYPIERLVYDLNLTQSETEFPLFDVAVLLENIQEYAYLQHIPNNVVFSFKRTEKSVEGTFRFNPLLYGKPTVQTWVEHMKRVMDQAFSNIDIPLKDIDILSEEDKRQLFETFNDTHVSFPGDLTIHGLFEKQVRETPGEIALMEAGTDPVAPDLCRRLTYKEVDEQSQRLANLLQARGVAPGSFVGIMVERSIEMVLAMLAVLKAGGTYVPVDPEYPLLRRQYMLQDSDAKILLTKKIYLEEKEIQESLKEIEIISVDDKGIYDEIDAGTTEAGKTSTPTDLAYIIYTSGSTGQPKGVMVEHCSIVNTLQWRKNYYSFTQKDNILQLPSFSFDSSVEDIFTPLISGSSLVLIQQEKRLDLEYLSKVIPTYRITHFLIVPGFYNTLLNECGDALTEVKTITVAGESFTEELVINHYKILENVRLFNEYGPTENSVCTTVHEFTADSTRIVIGKPIANVKCYILKDNRSTYPIGCWGELYTSGAGLARGYLKGFRQTEEKFVPHILEEGERMYRTGDLARWLPDGNLEFFGRVDQQVKIRGFRIEPGEIENLLLKYEGVKEAVVTAVEDETRDHAYLCAYVVADNDLSESVLEIKTFLGNDLVEYMVPQEFVFLETLPLTPSGKIDRKALPKPYVSGDTKKYTAPRDKVEKKMATIWAEVLGVKEDTIGIDSNFFALGGHSLKATVLVSRVYKELNVKLPLSNVFQSPTIRQLVGGIRQDESENKYAAIEKAKEKEYYPLTPAQKRLYILNRIDKETISYNTATIVRLKGSIEITQIERIFKQLILRHDSLRTSFHMEKGEPVQKIHGDVPFELEYSEADDDKVDSIIKNFVSPFNLEIAPIFRVGLIKTGPKNHILMVGMHHIISDGISHDVLVQDFLLLYTGEELAPMRIQYKDFSEWVNSEEQQKEAQQQEAYWKNEFSGEIPVLNLPYDFARPLVQSFEGSRFTINLDKEDTAALNALAARENCTLFMVLLSLYTIFLSKVSGQEDIVVGTPIAGRRHADLDRIIGMFVNTMVLRNKAGGDTTYREFLAEVRDRTWKTYENQEYQFEDLVEKLEIHRDPGRNPLFDVMLALQNMQDLVTQEGVELEDTGLTMEPYPFEDGISKFDMTLHAFEAEGQLILSFEYCTKLFKKETIETFSRYLIRVLDVVLKEPQSGICEIEIASEQDKQAILADFNDTRKEYPVNETIRQLFEYQVTETPDETAVAFREQRLSYKELNEKVNRLARTLHSHGVAIGTIVAVKTAPSIDMVVGTLAVLKTGGTYMPIDPDYPEERIKYMIADSGVQLLLTSGSPAETDTMKTLSLEDETIYHEDAANPGYGDSAAEPAYIMYTSGSTGKPKGVVVEHRSILRLVKNTNFIELNSPGRILQTGAFAFDASTFEIWGALLNGLSLYTVDKETVLSPGSLKETIEKNNIDTMWMTSPFFNQMVQSQIDIFAPLKHLLVGGDILNPVYIGKVKDKYPGLKIINGYGPTENTTFSTTYAIEKETKGNIPIGKPIANSTAYILDEYGHLLPVGAAGELCVGGDGVARGYLNNPELSAEKFLLNPFDDGKSYIYKTGDRARWLSDGNIEFLGRMDYQVKIRGFRIEPGEIEHQLLGHEKVTDAFVDIRENEKGDRFLCGYVVSAETFDTSELREFLARSLPDYMIPQYFVWMEKMPLTPNGKIDRNVLKKLEALASGKGEYVAPKTGMEKSITEIWQEVLGEEKIGIHDNFFEVGGNSLKIVQLSSKLKDVIGKDIPVATMFRYPTISSFARYVEHGETAGEMLSEDEISETIDEMDGAMQMFGEIEDE